MVMGIKKPITANIYAVLCGRVADVSYPNLFVTRRFVYPAFPKGLVSK